MVEETQQHTEHGSPRPKIYRHVSPQDGTSGRETTTPNNKNQWFLLILAAVLLFISLVLTASVFFISHDPRSFGLVGSTAPLISSLYRYYFPPSAEEYRLKELKLRLKFAAASHKKACERQRQGKRGDLE
ncbi:MAG: hypothetical protein M3Z08_17515 [Chloroflexota bacterium]|nr:hypothetical protein [Chloroflexota bacterium]